MNGKESGHFIDVVVCLESTGGFAPIFDIVKEKVISLYPSIATSIIERGEHIEQFRIKVISFRDYAVDKEPMVESEFFVLPEQSTEFCAYVDAIEAKGGGDSPENSLEAISLAIRSEWNTCGDNRTQKIVVITDSPPLTLGARRMCSITPYPTDMPADLSELKDWWSGKKKVGTFEPSNATMDIVFSVPSCKTWSEMSKWERCNVSIDKNNVYEEETFSETNQRQEHSVGYNLDLVICIDSTGSMQPIIKELQNNALAIYQLVLEGMEEYDQVVEQLRVKIISFRDFRCDDEALTESPFYTLPDQNDELKAFLNDVVAQGGGDAPENALEALALALKSDWTTTTGGTKRRHAIVMLSDAPAIPLGECASCSHYPTDMPENIEQLHRWWDGSDQMFNGTFSPRVGRLVAFVPETEPWIELQAWNRYLPVFSAGGTGLPDIDIRSIIDLVVASF